MSAGAKLELKPNMLAGAVQLFFDNYVMDRDFRGKNMPHGFLTSGIILLGVAAYYGLLMFGGINLPIYILAIFPVAAFIIQIYFLYGELKNRSYLIHEDSIEIQDDFLDKESNSARFENITDVKLEKPFIQRLFGTGDIRLSTAGKGIESELVIRYLDNPQEYYQKLSDLVNSREYNQELH